MVLGTAYPRIRTLQESTFAVAGYSAVTPYIPLFSLVQLGYPAITNIFAVDQIIRYNGVFAITKTPPITNIFIGTVTLRYSRVPL